MSLAVIIPMRRLAAAIVATTLPALPATAHTGNPHPRAAVAGGIAIALPGVASEITSPDRTMEGSRPVTVAQSPSASTLTLRAHQAAGELAIVVDGTAPAALPVRITLTGEISRDIPTVTLYSVTLATDGTFHAVLPIAPTMPRDSVVIVTATTLSGASNSAQARVAVGAPNPQLDTRFDHLDPKD